MAGTDPTIEEIADWLTPDQAIQTLDAAFDDTYLSKCTLLGYLTGGRVRSIAMDSTVGGREVRFVKIPKDHWQNIPIANDIWRTGYVTYKTRDRSSIEIVTFQHFDVRFDPSAVQAIVANVTRPSKVLAASPSSPKEIETNKGGAPRKAWWDDFWIEICRKIYDNELKAPKQADLERAMLDWASMNGHDMSETSAKVAARKLFKAWKLGGKN